MSNHVQQLATVEHRRNWSFIELLTAAAGVISTFVLFYIDVIMPRGILDGIAYPVVIVIAARYGRVPLLAWSALCTILIIVAYFLVPDTGVSISGEFANRVVGVASVCITAYLMHRQLQIEERDAARGKRLYLYQQTLARIVNETSGNNRTLLEQIKFITETTAEVFEADFVGVFRYYERGVRMHNLDTYDLRRGVHMVLPDNNGQRVEGVEEALRESSVAVLNDISFETLPPERRALFERLNIRAGLTAGVFIHADLAGQITFAKAGRPYQWSAEDVGFARAVGSVVTSIYARELNNQTLAALNVVRAAIYIEDKDGVPIYANWAAIALGAGSLDVAHYDEVALSRLDLPRPAAALLSDKDSCEISFGEREFEIDRACLPDGGTIVRINDITQRNSESREHKRLEARLRQAEKLEALGHLAGGVAHDFNNLLGAIMGFAGFLEQDLQAGSEPHRFASRIMAASQRGKDLVDQILTFARSHETGGDVADLADALYQTLDLVRASFPSSVVLDFAGDPDGLFVACGASRVSQLLFNLCINARDAIGSNPGVITVRVSRIHGGKVETLASRPGEMDTIVGAVNPAIEYAGITVRDTGGGIAQDVLARMFEPFYSTKDRGRGTGLGLAVVHGVIDAAGGFCQVHVTPGQGTEFAVYLPLANPVLKPAATYWPAGPRGTERILVVDDEPDIVDMMTIGLERLGYHAVGVSDPVEALQAVTEDPQAFDVVVTDFIMPAMNGNELISSIKILRPDMRTILCTAFNDGMGGGQNVADASFRKPVAAPQIASCIRTLLDKDVNAA